MTQPSLELATAFQYALGLHGGQVRKQSSADDSTESIPYIAHLMVVAALVLEHGGTEEEAIAALLHDGPEDQGGRATLEKIRTQPSPPPPRQDPAARGSKGLPGRSTLET